jgi:hypothetical protein
MKFNAKFNNKITLGEVIVIDTRIVSTILTVKQQIESYNVHVLPNKKE